MIEVAVGVLTKAGAVWTRRRRQTGHLDGYLEFPGGKLEPGESALAALLREVREETGIVLPEDAPESFGTERHAYPRREVLIHFFICPVGDAEPAGPGGWEPIARLRETDFPPANRAIIQRLKSRADQPAGG